MRICEEISRGPNGYTGMAPAGGIGLVQIDPGLALGLPPGTFQLLDGTAIDVETQFRSMTGTAGIAFDIVGGSFKFAALVSQTTMFGRGSFLRSVELLSLVQSEGFATRASVGDGVTFGDMACTHAMFLVVED